MINELINSINGMLALKFPNTKVYLSKSEENFQRPSLFIRYITSKQNDLNRNCYENIITIKIIYYPVLDEFMNADLISQNEILDTMREIFSNGYIKVLDRSAKIKDMRGRAKNTEIHLKLKMNLVQDKVFNIPESPKADKINLNF